MIDASWSTSRLYITDTAAKDIPHLQLALNTIQDTLRLEGKTDADPEEMQTIFTYGDLPPGGRKECYRLQSISLRQSRELIGFISLYHGFPEPETLYIASLSIQMDRQNHLYGTELIAQLPQLPGLAGYTKHRVVVSVRNWRALKFWVQNGFNTLVGVSGELDAVTSETARLELLRYSLGGQAKS